MTTTYDLDRLAAAYLTRVLEPSDTSVGVFRTIAGIHETLGALSAEPHLAPRIKNNPFDADHEAARLAGWEKQGMHLLTRGDEHWPQGLDDLGAHAPYGLWWRGNPETLGLLATTRTVAIVGARAASSYGEHVALEMAADLSRDHLVVSGGAYGIDGAAHRAALSASERTVIVSASGISRPYPAGHQHLFERVQSGKGLVVSEVYPDAQPTKWRFLARNRVIAALAPATLIIEAGWRSGTLNTVGHAISLGRKVGAVPGPITSATSAGPHKVIRELGGVLITTPDDVRELTREWQR